MHNLEIISNKLYKTIQASTPILNIDAIMYNDEKEVYLQYRTVIPHKNKWTILGGRLRIHEGVEKCLFRHVSDSGLRVYGCKFVGYYDWKKWDSRQHSVSLIFLVKVEGDPITGKFFSILPNNMPLSVKRCINKFYKMENKR